MITATPTVAHRRAQNNLASNSDALGAGFTLTDVEFIFGRDGSLTARDGDGNWFSGSSLPRRVAEKLLEKFTIRGQSACMLAPTHPSQIACVLARLERSQALMAMVPDGVTASLFLSCEDFSSDLRAGRLHLIFGKDWAKQLEEVLNGNPGLAVPTQFIRLPISDAAVVDGMIPESQRVFSQVNARRNAMIGSIRSNSLGWTSQTLKLCVVAPSGKRMFDDSTSQLRRLLDDASAGDIQTCIFDPDEPGRNSTLQFAQLASTCNAILAADLGRSDLPNLVDNRTSWITWVTGIRIPSPVPAATSDRLLLCDPSLTPRALAAGWKEPQISCARWQSIELAGSGDGHLAIFADTSLIEIPDAISDYSSHELLWDALVADIARDPIAVYERSAELLNERALQFQIAPAAIDTHLWLESLIVPAYQHAIARLLIHSNIPLKLFGRNWAKIEDLRPHSAGDVTSATDFEKHLTVCSGVVHSLPIDVPSAANFMNRAVLRPQRRDAKAFIKDAREAVRGRPTVAVGGLAFRNEPEISLALIRKLVSR